MDLNRPHHRGYPEPNPGPAPTLNVTVNVYGDNALATLTPNEIANLLREGDRLAGVRR